MAVVINEFEIIAEPAPSSKQHESEQKATGMRPPVELTPHDLSRIMRHERDRDARYWAH